MKALIATPYYYPKVGGLETYARDIANGLRAAGWEIVVVTSDPHVRAMTSEQLDGYTLYRLPVWKVLSNTPIHTGWPRMLRSILQFEQPDVINIHTPVPSMALAVMMSAKQTPVVVTYHAGSMKKGRLAVDLLIGLYERTLLPDMLNSAKGIICASDFVRTSFLANWTDKSVTVTPGVDTDKFAPRGQAIRGRLVFIGDFRDPRKGLDVLLAAVKQLPDVHLRVIGQGEPKKQARVTYTGVKIGTDLVKALRQAQVLVLPSTTDAEAFGVVLIEAMACGLPVIGSNIGGIGTVIEHGKNGLLVPPSDVKALVRAISTLTSDPDKALTLGAEGRKRAVTRYSVSTRVEATARVLEAAV